MQLLHSRNDNSVIVQPQHIPIFNHNEDNGSRTAERPEMVAQPPRPPCKRRQKDMTMAYAVHNKGTALSVTARLGEVLGQAAEAYRAWRLYRRTFNELSGLSARELDDLGISRSSIRRIALESAYGPAL